MGRGEGPVNATNAPFPGLHLDTHVVVWLAAGASHKVAGRVLRRIREAPPVVSPVVAMELDRLHEIGRIREPGLRVLEHLEATIGLTVSPVPFVAAVAASRELRWTRDPFDRLITASALAEGAALATADATIRANFPLAVWD
jgi:PIN domain nuclease of toxin-antitoxin system